MSGKPIPSVRTTVDLPEPLFRQAKVQAALRGITLKELLTEALRQALKSPPARLREDAPDFLPEAAHFPSPEENHPSKLAH